MRRVAWIASFLVIPLLLGLGLSQVMRDTTPPGVWLEAPERVPAGSAQEFFVSASEPVTFAIRYGDLATERVAQDLTMSLLVEPGERVLQIAAIDGAGNRTTVEWTVVGVPVPEPTLIAPARIAAGAPVTVELLWRPGDADVAAMDLTADGRDVPLVRRGAHAIGFLAAPLTTEPSSIALHASITDAFGERREVATELAVDADPSPVEELDVPASTLSVITPEGRVQEREALERAYASTVPMLRWRKPFLMPVEGTITSAYGGPRRYAPGGPVSFHTGTDLRAPTGTPIRATNDGVVQVADFYPIKGGLVAIDHGGGVTSLYFHQSRIFVEVGDVVRRGDVIGESGATGLVTGPHLHWEMQVLGRPSDPMAWVGRVVPGQPRVGQE